MHFFVTHVVVPYMPHHSVPRLGSACPHSGIAPWARREGPSMAQRGYLGIHAEVPTPQYLRSASVVNGAPQIKIKSEAA
ncbi:nucleoid-structuring protein H-NS [Pseudomonas sp. E141]|uniref:nucleoid-structuring protein H-NS n=1 Tax=Pseudomonas sp. E141 TaxID=2875961 RepID=UPI004045883E